MRFGSKMRGALVPAHETMCCSAIRGASRRMSVLRGLQIQDLSLRRTVRKLAARQAMRFTSAWVWKAIGSGKGICRSLLQRASSADRLLDFLRLRVRAGVEGAVGRVFGSAALTIYIVHSLQRRDVSRFEARDVRALPRAVSYIVRRCIPSSTSWFIVTNFATTLSTMLPSIFIRDG